MPTYSHLIVEPTGHYYFIHNITENYEYMRTIYEDNFQYYSRNKVNKGYLKFKNPMLDALARGVLRSRCDLIIAESTNEPINPNVILTELHYSSGIITADTIPTSSQRPINGRVIIRFTQNFMDKHSSKVGCFNNIPVRNSLM